MIPESILMLAIVAYIHKKIRFYFVLKKAKNKKYVIKEGAEPYLIKKGKIGVLFIHGFTSSPQEGKGLANYLASKDITVYAPLLKGHGTKVEDLARTRKEDWEESALQAFDKLASLVDKIYIAGSSVGGNLALRISTKRKVNGIISMGTPMFFRREKYARIAIPLNLIFRSFIKKKFDEKEKEIIKHKIHYDSFPLNCLPSGIKLVKLSGKDLPKITAPILIMQSKTDKVLAIENIDFIYNKISSKIKKKVIIPDSYHVFLIDKYKEDAFKEIYSFIKEIEELNEKPILTTPIKV
jgi:carboxylesterase